MNAKAKIGQSVQVELAGLKIPGLAIGKGIFGHGEIAGLDPENHKVTIKLKDLVFREESFNYIEAPSKQVMIIEHGDARACYSTRA